MRITDCLHHWAKQAPDRVFMAERTEGGGWREVTYVQMLAIARRVASGTAGARGCPPTGRSSSCPGNSLDHALLAFGALYAGIPYAPVSPAYSLVSKDFGKLAYLMTLLTPGLVFVDDAARLCRRDRRQRARGCRSGRCPWRAAGSSGDTPGGSAGDAGISKGLDALHEAIESRKRSPKFLLTSGSTGNPKAVINTQRMLCANQIMIRDTLAFLKDEPPVINRLVAVESYLVAATHNIGLTLFNGGSMYLDDGKPTPSGIAATIRNLREISPTVYFNVPKGYESLLRLPARRCRIACKVLPSAACDVLQRRRPCRRSSEESLDALSRAADRRARADALRAWRHRDRAFLHVRSAGQQPLRPCRPACAGQ